MPDSIALYAPTRTQGEFKTLRIDESVAGTTYFGMAPIGSSTGSSAWQIKRLVEVAGTTSITWADGNSEFDNVWDNRASLSYS